MPHKITDLTASSIIIYTISMMIALSWINLFNTAIDNYAESIGKQNGINEMMVRLGVVVIITAFALLFLPKLLKRHEKRLNSNVPRH